MDTNPMNPSLPSQPLTLEEAIQLGLTYHRQNALGQAKNIYESILTQYPNHPDALHLLGLIKKEEGDFQTALQLIQQAIALQPQEAIFQNNLGVILLDLRQPAEAKICFENAIALNGNYAEAFNNLARAQSQLKDYESAIRNYETALRLNPNYASAYSNLGTLYHERFELEKAVSLYQKAIELKPDFAEAYSDLGAAYQELENFEQAIIYYEKSIAINPNYPGSYTNLGFILQELKRYQEAIPLHEQAIKLKPDFYQAYNNLGCAYMGSWDLENAIVNFEKALSIRPDYVDCYHSLGIAYYKQGLLEKALTYFNDAIEMDSDYPETHWDRANVWLLQGDYTRGWPEYEWRFKKRNYPPRKYNKPQWQGESLVGKTIFIYAEQGLGDTIQFARFLPQVKEQAQKVIFECHPELKQLLQHCQGFDEILDQDESKSHEPDFDVHSPLMSLPWILKTTLETIPLDIPYIHPEETDIERWKLAIPHSDSLKIGFVWSGRLTYKNDHLRACRFEDFSRLFEVPGTTFFSLQIDQPFPEDNSFENCINLGKDIRNFSDTAEIIQHLDLVISIDTAVGHLAGAMGKPVWVLIPYTPDWRWMQNRTDNAWYPNHRLFRQSKPMDWADVFKSVYEALSQYQNNRL